MIAKVQKWGNSLAVRIPSALAKNSHVQEGTDLEITSENDSIVLRKAKSTRKYSLKELADRITPENIHSETDWGNSVGRERFWESE